MTKKIERYFAEIFQILINSGGLIIPSQDIIADWKNTLTDWVNDNSSVLFLRKGNETRGQRLQIFNRPIMTTDNTPAHWVFKNLVLNKLTFTKNQILEMIESNNFPVSFVRKKKEHITLIGKMVANKETRLNEEGWKLAHIERIGIKRGKTVTIEHYKSHHMKFLDLDNMYLIKKEYSGLAEVESFNAIVKDHKKSIKLPIVII